MAKTTCLFCTNLRTRKRGEHLWDDWLNREDGKDIRRPSTASFYGMGGRLIREYDTDRLEVTLPLVCDRCNNTWMSDLSSRAKELLEGCIRRDEPASFNQRQILTLTAFFFLKSAVLDWSAASGVRRPCISPARCLSFRSSLVTKGSTTSIALPPGLQVWIARYRRSRAMEAQAFTEEMSRSRHLKGYKVLVVTYVVGSFIFQLLYPRRVKKTHHRHPPPFFKIPGDRWSVPIWPGVSRAHWPPLKQIDGRSLEIFRERFRRVRIPRTT